MNEQKVRRRFETHGSGAPLVLPPDHLAMREQRTLFPNTVRSANPDELVLKSGIHSTKLGDKIVKGVWKEALIFSLTLEERKTCPITCQQLPLCMGNGMHLGAATIHSDVLGKGARRRTSYPISYLQVSHVSTDRFDFTRAFTAHNHAWSTGKPVRLT
jgi:hypothetical protein